MFNVTYLFR